MSASSSRQSEAGFSNKVQDFQYDDEGADASSELAEGDEEEQHLPLDEVSPFSSPQDRSAIHINGREQEDDEDVDDITELTGSTRLTDSYPSTAPSEVDFNGRAPSLSSSATSYSVHRAALSKPLPAKPQPGPLTHARFLLEHQAASLLSAARRMREEEETYGEFQGAQGLIVDVLKKGGKLVWTGVGKSGIIAQKLCASSLSLGLPACYLDPMAALHGDLGALNGIAMSNIASSSSSLPLPSTDVLIALSHSGSSAELSSLIPHVKLRGVKIIALTAARSSTLGEAAKETGGHWIDCRTAGRGDDPSSATTGSSVRKMLSLSSAQAGTDEADPSLPAPTSSTTTALAMGDSLVLSCARMLGLGKDDFAIRHPGGSLGQRFMAELEDKKQQEQEQQQQGSKECAMS